MSPIRMEKIESAMRVVLDFSEAFNRHDVTAMTALMSADCVFENTTPAPDGMVYRGQAIIRKYWEEFFFRSPQAKITIEEVFGMGRRCILRWRCDWTDMSGAQGYIRGVDVFQVRDGLITEKFSYVKG